MNIKRWKLTFNDSGESESFDTFLDVMVALSEGVAEREYEDPMYVTFDADRLRLHDGEGHTLATVVPGEQLMQWR